MQHLFEKSRLYSLFQCERLRYMHHFSCSDVLANGTFSQSIPTLSECRVDVIHHRLKSSFYHLTCLWQQCQRKPTNHSVLLMCCRTLLYHFPHEFISWRKTLGIYSVASSNLTELHHLPPLTSSVLRRRAEARLMALREETPVQDQKALPHWSCADSVSECECHLLLTPVL